MGEVFQDEIGSLNQRSKKKVLKPLKGAFFANFRSLWRNARGFQKNVTPLGN